MDSKVQRLYRAADKGPYRLNFPNRFNFCMILFSKKTIFFQKKPGHMFRRHFWDGSDIIRDQT